MKVAVFGLVVLLASSCYGARILGLLTMPSRSHGILMERIMRELAGRGHHITYITAAPPAGKEPVPNMTLISLPDVHELLLKNSPKSEDGKAMNMFSLKGMSGWFMFFFTLASTGVCDFILEQPDVQKLIKSDQKFDLVLAETFLDESIIAGLSHRFNAPIVGVMSFMPNIWANYLTGNPAQSSYIPDPNLGYSTEMSFFQRVHSFIFSLAWDFYHPMIYLPKHDALMKKYFGEDTPPIHDILRKTSLVLVNHHYSLAFPRPNLPNMIEVAGMHINPVKPLPSDLKAYLDGSPEGVILFSMGSNLRSADLTQTQLQSILQAFKRLPFKVLWKFEADLEGLPKNVKIGKWLPQSDILAHPNTKLFITHGGLLSTTEAVHNGVPVLGIPIFGDQPLNMRHTENAGLGKTFDLDDLTKADNFYNAIMEVATNPSFMAAAKTRSSVFRDTEKPPIERAVWWVEYVIRHNGAPHLQSGAQHLAWYQLHQLDVIAALTALIALVLYIVKVSIKAIYCKLCSATQKKKNLAKTKKNN